MGQHVADCLQHQWFPICPWQPAAQDKDAWQAVESHSARPPLGISSCVQVRHARWMTGETCESTNAAIAIFPFIFRCEHCCVSASSMSHVALMGTIMSGQLKNNTQIINDGARRPHMVHMPPVVVSKVLNIIVTRFARCPRIVYMEPPPRTASNSISGFPSRRLVVTQFALVVHVSSLTRELEA